MTGSRRAPLVVLSVCVFFAICTEVLPVGLLPEISRGLRVSVAATGVLVSLYAVLVAVASVPLAALVERWPRRAVLAALLAGYAVSNLAVAVAPGYGVAIAARVVGGLAHAGFFAVAVATGVSLVDSARPGRAITVLGVGNALALVLGVPLGTVLGTALGWRWSFVALAVVTLGLALTVLRVLPRAEQAHTAPRTSVLVGVRRPAVLVMAAVIALLALGHFTLYTYISPLLLHAGIAPIHVGEVLFAYGCGGLLGVVLAGLVVNRCPNQALAVDMVLMVASLVLAATVGSAVGIVVVAVVWGVAFGAFPSLTQTVMLEAAGDATDASTSLVNATTNVGIAGGSFLGSRLLGVTGVPTLGWVGAGLVVASFVVYAARLLRRRAGGTAGTAEA